MYSVQMPGRIEKQGKDMCDLKKGKGEFVNDPLISCNDKSPEDFMKLLMSNPELTSNVLELVKMYNNVATMSQSKFTGNTIMEESSEDFRSESGDTKIEDQTQVVMLPSDLPESRPTYAINTASNSKPSSSVNEMSVAVPAENLSIIPEEQTNVNITEESSNAEFVVPMETVSSINMTLSADQIQLCKKAKPYPVLEEPVTKICSDELQQEELNVNNFYTFCERINSPEHTLLLLQNASVENLDDCFENSIANHSYSPNHLTSSPEYAISSPKTTTLDPSSPEAWTGSPASSICDDSDVENDFVQDWESLKDLENIMERDLHNSVASPASTVSSVYSMEDSNTKIQKSPVSSTQFESYDLYPESVHSEPLSPATLSSVELIEDSNMEDDISDCEMPHANQPIPVTTSIFQPQFLEQNSPSERKIYLDVTSSVVTSDTLGKSPANLVVSAPGQLPWNIVCQETSANQVNDYEDLDESPKSKRRCLESNFDLQNNPYFPVPLSQFGFPWLQAFNIQPSPVQELEVKDMIKKHPVFRQDQDGDLPLHVSVLKEDVHKTKQLLEIMDGIYLDTTNRKLQTPLHLAGYVENASLMSMLLQSGANPELVDADGNNLFHISCMKGSMTILNTLYEYSKKDVSSAQKVANMLEACNYEGYSPLHLAVRDFDPKSKDMKVIDFLMKLNCNLDNKDMTTGTTALIYALKNEYWTLAKHLIINGANVNVATNAGMYPLDFVGLSNNLELARDLISRNAESGVKTEFPNKEMKNLFESELRKRRRKRNQKARQD